MNSIITPSYNMLNYLKLCCSSVADQNTEKEHIVIDANSTDGTKGWGFLNKDILFFSEPDNGMYDAINKGLKQSKYEIISYLNCDEQYLPNTLSFVNKYFNSHKDIDLLFGNTLVVNPKGTLLSYRKGYQPRYYYIKASHLYVLSCSMFFRRKIIDDGNFFNINYRDVGDAEFVLRLLKKGYKAKHVNKYLSVFTFTGNNMSLGENAILELSKIRSMPSFFLKPLRPFINMLRIFEKVKSGAYWQRFPLSYSIYLFNEYKRTSMYATNATFKWPQKILK